MYTMKEQLEHLEGEIDIMLSSELDQWNNKYIPLIQIVEEHLLRVRRVYTLWKNIRK